MNTDPGSGDRRPVTARWTAPILAITIGATCAGSPTAPVRIDEITREPGLTGFPARLDSIRVQLRIPGMAAAIAQDGRIVWSAGFGFADAVLKRRADAQTPFHLASLTKPFASVVVMQLVEQGRIDLDAPVSAYGVSLEAQGTIRVRHLLTHTSEGVPGTQYRYSGNRYGYLDAVIESATGRGFADLLAERVLGPLGLHDTAPNPAQSTAFAFSGLDRKQFEARMAAGYAMSGGTPVPTEHPTYFGTAAGLVASAEDVAAFSIAIDQGRLLEADTWRQVFKPATSTATGDTLPYGLGWFIQRHDGITLQWHYGYWTTNSSLIVRVPDRRLTFVVLANTPALSAAYSGLGSDDNVLRSDVARLFVEAFVTGDEALPGPGPGGHGG